MEDDIQAYYRRRAYEETEAAKASVSPGLASAHRLLAIEYEAAARELDDHHRMPRRKAAN